MSNTFFPINETSFIKHTINKIKKLNDIDNWLDIYHLQIENEVSYLSFQNNIMIIDEYAGCVYEAINLYKDHFGEFIIPDNKHSFYAQLSYISVYEKFFGVIERLVEKIKDEDSDSDYEIDTDDTDDDYNTDDTNLTDDL